MAEPTIVNCPGCGGEVPVATKAARTAACPYCHSTLIVNEAAIRALGKMALLAETPSCLAVGWRARCAGREILVLGRLQFRYRAGLWDEWWVQFADDGSFAWISQDEDEYVLERPLAKLTPPDYDTVQPGDRVKLGKHTLWVEEKDEAVMVGMQGELPRDAAPECPMRYLELTDNAHHLTIEYFDDGTAEGFLGRRLQRNDLQAVDQPDGAAAWGLPYAAPTLSGPPEAAPPVLGTGPESEAVVTSSAGLRPRTVNCPQCGGTVEVRDAQGTAMVACQHCGSGLDVTQPGKVQLLYQSEEKRLKSALPMGATGTFQSVEWTVLGRVRYREDDFSGYWIWDEWQLHSAERGYAFLAVENGHWMWFEPLQHRVQFDPRSARPKQRVSLHGQSFKVFERSRALITYVEGELSWVARLGDKLGFMDAIRPPQMLSAEWTENELEWSLGRYVPRAEIAEAFGIAEDQLPRPSGVAPAQPFVRTKGQGFRAWTGLAVAVFLFGALLLAFASGGGKKVFDSGSISSNQYLSERGYVSPPIEIPDGTHVCKLHAHSSGVNNSWVALSVAFLDEDENVVMDADQTVEYYHGVEGGESWSEGSRSDSTFFVLTGPKKYRLNVFGEAGTWSPRGESKTTSGAAVQMQLYRDSVPVRYFVIASLLALIYPVWEFGRKLLFESRRWPSDDDD